MTGPTLATLALACTVVLVGTGAAQEAASPDLRTLSLRSLKIGRTIRVVGQDIGKRTGPFFGVRDGALWLNGPSPASVPLAGIDSVWVGHGHPAAGALVGLLVGSLIASAVLSHQSCSFLESNCIDNAMGTATAMMLGATLVGAGLGTSIKTWELRYP